MRKINLINNFFIMNNKIRLKIINDLVNNPKNLENLEEIDNNINKFEWDYEWEKIILKSNKLKEIFLKNINNYNFLSKWASMIELRDDIEYEKWKIRNISEIINILSMPEINWYLDEKTFIEILKMNY